MATPKGFIEQVNAIANATQLATGDIVEDTQIARDEAVAAAAAAATSEANASSSESLANDWANKGHNNPVTGTIIGNDAEFSAYHWSVEAGLTIGDPIINDAIVSSNYTWSSSKIGTELDGKSDSDHNHNTLYEPKFTKGTAFNKNFSAAGGENGVSTDVARSDHNHASAYMPKVTVNTAYNKNFGTTSGTVMEGDRNFDANYMPKVTVNTAYNKNFVVNTEAPLADEVPRGNHTHKAQGISYDNTGNDVISSTTVQGALGQLDSTVGAISIAEKCKLTASLTDTSYNVPVAVQSTWYQINAGVTLGGYEKNAVYSNGVKVAYPIAPTKLVEGHYSVTATVELLANEVIELAIGVNGVVDSNTAVELGSSDKATTGAFPVTISGFVSALSQDDVITLHTRNMTGTQDILLYDLFISFAGEPEGALVAAGVTVNHSDTTSRDAPNQHPLESIYETGSGRDLADLLTDKADKVVVPTLDNLLAMDASGNLKDSGIAITDATNHMDKIASPTLDNLVAMDSGGQSKDSGFKASDFALTNGDSLETFAVANAVNPNDAMNKSQIDAIAATYTLQTTFDTHEATSNPHGTTYTDVGAAAASHTHDISEVTSLQDSLNAKYDEVVGAVTDNIPAFGAGDILVDSGYSKTALEAADKITTTAVTSVTFNADGTITIVTP